VMAISALFSYRYYLEAEDSRILADSTLAKLQANLERQRLENFERYFGQGLYSMDLGDYEKAITQFDVALTFDTLNEDAELARQDAQELFGLKILFDTLMLKGVRAMENNDLVAARESFEKALNDFATDDNSIKRAETKMDEARIKMMPAFRTSVDRAFIFYEAEDCSLARSVLRRAQRLQPYLRKRDIERELKKIEKIKSGCR
jgi:tetratricopeptide (TPR) repeat protein